MFQVYNIARIYARALFGFAKKQNIQKEWGGCLEHLQQLSVLREVHAIVYNPGIALETKVSILVNLVNCNTCNMKNFLKLIITRNRFFLLKKILNFYNEYLLQDQNIQIVYVLAAYELDEVTLDILKSNLQKQLQKEVLLKVEVKNSLIAGLVLRINDKIIDGSISGKIENLNIGIKEMVCG